MELGLKCWITVSKSFNLYRWNWLTDWHAYWVMTDCQADSDWNDCLTIGLTDWLWLTGWLSDWLTDWLTVGLTDWLTDCRTDWLTDCRTDWLNDCQTDWLNDCRTDWMTVGLTDWLAYWLIEWLDDWQYLLSSIRCESLSSDWLADQPTKRPATLLTDWGIAAGGIEQGPWETPR